MSEKTKSVLNRFYKGMVSGAVTVLALVTYATPKSWEEIGMLINFLVVAAIGGAINGAILAAQKWASWTE